MISWKGSRFLTLLDKQAGPEKVRLLAACMTAGLVQGLAVFSVLRGMEQMFSEGIRVHTFLAFLLCLGIFYKLFRYMTERASLLALEGIMEWRMRLATKLRGIGTLAFEKIDRGLLQAVLLDEGEMMVEGTRMLVISVASSVMILVAFMKMLEVSSSGGLTIIALLGLGLFIFLRLVRGVYSFMEAAQEAEKAFLASLRDLQEGFRQLKLHKPKTTALFADSLIPGLNDARKSRSATEGRHGKAISFFAIFHLLVLGMILFFMPGFLGLDAKSTSTLLVLSMFCLSPMMSLVGFMPMLTKIEMSLERMAELEAILDNEAEHFEIQHARDSWQYTDPTVPAFESLLLHDVRFDYVNQQGLHLFGIRADYFSLNRGELVFIRGGNGSGKTTFMNVLSGLYPVQSGEFFLNGIPLADVGLEAYRNLFTVLPTDFHLFSRPLGIKASPRRVDEVLASMRIDHKVHLEEDGSFSTLDLSAGQRKRLALACALLEDRDLLLLDEVAADFDPSFRVFFYDSLLPQLKKQGKTILAISHDDRYFYIADRVLTMRDGVLCADGSLE